MARRNAQATDTRPFAPFEWMLALRYLRARRKEGFISVLAGFSFLGILLGVFTLITVMAVMNGFRKELFSKILGLNGHIIVNKVGGDDFDNYDEVAKLLAALPGVKHAVPLMSERGGAIVVTASVNALKPHARQLAYTATKHATVGIIRCAALDLGRFNIRVNGLAPGPIATAALRERVRFRSTIGGPPEDAALRALAEETPLGRIATEHEVAKAALFLASDLASAITGHLLPVDAGLSSS